MFQGLARPMVLAGALLSSAEACGEDAAAGNQHSERALALTRRQAQAYSIEIGHELRPLTLVAQPVLKWSNPEAGEIHGHVFLWTDDGRPQVVGSLFKWFSPHTHLSHEFVALTSENLRAQFQGEAVWQIEGSPADWRAFDSAPTVAQTAVARLQQMRTLARTAEAVGIDREGTEHRYRLLSQPVYRYPVADTTPAKRAWVDGALFVFVQGTDPEVFLLVEASQSGRIADWRYCLFRMNSCEQRVQINDREVWSVDQLPWADVFNHRGRYTSFRVDDVEE